MKPLRRILTISIFMILFAGGYCIGQNNVKTLFDSDWLFHRGGAQGAEEVTFNDSQWRKVCLPHDWSIEDLPGKNTPFSIDAISQVSGGFTTGGTGWYRKYFEIGDSLKGKSIIIMFEGIYMNSDIWINGSYLGEHPYGYTSFWYDISDKLQYGKKNLIAVKVKNEGENSRWYSGSGIYRHVWFEIKNNIHFSTWGTSITTPVVNEKESTVRISNIITNDSGNETVAIITTKIRGADGSVVSSDMSDVRIEKGESAQYTQMFNVTKPSLWSPETPKLYTAVSEIIVNGKTVDISKTSFGIRSVSSSSAAGLLINGKAVKLKGGCVHHDNGVLGAAAFDRAEERRVELLKASWFNAIRCSHNPPSPAFLDACDRLGMFVIDESFDMWSDQKNPADYHLYFDKWWKSDLKSMVFRDRNHPSIIMWSIGNEIPNRHTPEVVKLAKLQADYLRSLDPTRPLTSAVNDLKPDKDPYFSVIDVAGYNYAEAGASGSGNQYEIDHERVPERLMIGTESFPLLAFESWMDVTDHTYVAGDFVWTSFDYIGEASIGWRGYFQKQSFFPWNLAYCGDIDICGWKRPQSYYRDALWKENSLSLWVSPPQPSFAENAERMYWSKWHWYDVLNDWNWEGSKGKQFEVTAYSSCPEVELFLNGISLGRKPTNRSTEFKTTWSVPYEPGTLSAKGYNGRKILKTAEIRTAGKAAGIRLSADRTTLKTGNQDLSYITAEITDSAGNLVPKAGNILKFSLSGPATIAGVGNADPVSLESYQRNERRTWRGKCLIVLRSGNNAGRVLLKVSSEGLPDSTIEIQTE